MSAAYSSCTVRPLGEQLRERARLGDARLRVAEWSVWKRIISRTIRRTWQPG